LEDWSREISWITVTIVKFNPDTQLREIYFQLSYGGEGEIEILGFRGPGGHGFGQETFLSHEDVLNSLESDGSLNILISVGMYNRIGVEVIEHVFSNCFSSPRENSTYKLPNFGRADNQWQVIPSLDGGSDSSGSKCMSIYLKPVKNKVEMQMGSNWRRIITGVTIKLLQGDDSVLLASKIFTGSFIFSDMEKHDVCGWPLFVTTDSILFPLETYTISVSILIDPKANADHFIDPYAKSLAFASSRLHDLHTDYSSISKDLKITKDNLSEVMQQVKNLRNVEESNVSLKLDLEKAHRQIADWRNIVETMKVEIIDLKKSSEQKTGDVSAMKIAVAKVKLLLTNLRVFMEAGPLDASGEANDEESWDNVSDEIDSSPNSTNSKVVVGRKKKTIPIKIETVPLSELLKLQSKISIMESEMSSLKADYASSVAEKDLLKWELDHIQRLPDQLYIRSFPESDELYDSDNEGNGTSPDIIQTMSNLVDNAKESIRRAVNRSSVQMLDPVAKVLDLASVTADLATIQAELEIARVPFIEIASKAASNLELFSGTSKNSDIQRVNVELDSVRISLINTLYEVESNRGSSCNIGNASNGFYNHEDSQQSKEALRQKMDAVKAENAEYTAEIARLKSKLEVIESVFKSSGEASTLLPSRTVPSPSWPTPPSMAPPPTHSSKPNLAAFMPPTQYQPTTHMKAQDSMPMSINDAKSHFDMVAPSAAPNSSKRLFEAWNPEPVRRIRKKTSLFASLVWLLLFATSIILAFIRVPARNFGEYSDDAKILQAEALKAVTIISSFSILAWSYTMDFMNSMNGPTILNEQFASPPPPPPPAVESVIGYSNRPSAEEKEDSAWQQYVNDPELKVGGLFENKRIQDAAGAPQASPPPAIPTVTELSSPAVETPVESVVTSVESISVSTVATTLLIPQTPVASRPRVISPVDAKYDIPEAISESIAAVPSVELTITSPISSSATSLAAFTTQSTLSSSSTSDPTENTPTILATIPTTISSSTLSSSKPVTLETLTAVAFHPELPNDRNRIPSNLQNSGSTPALEITDSQIPIAPEDKNTDSLPAIVLPKEFSLVESIPVSKIPAISIENTNPSSSPTPAIASQKESATDSSASSTSTSDDKVVILTAVSDPEPLANGMDAPYIPAAKEMVEEKGGTFEVVGAGVLAEPMI